MLWQEAEGSLYWVDIQEGRVHRLDPKEGTVESRELGKQVGALIPRRGGDFLAALEDGFYGYTFASNRLEFWGDPMRGDASNRFNDGKAGPDGRVYLGTVGPASKQQLYRIRADRSFAPIISGVTCSNGLAWSKDRRTFYYIDTPTCEVAAFDFDPESGDIAHRRVAVSIDEKLGKPDGMTIDAEGMLWIAHWEGSAVRRWDPASGQILAEITIPVSRVTCCAFGGPNFEDLYITTASVGLDAAGRRSQPLAGGLFRACPGVSGLPNHLFSG